ncbi:MAG: AAA family ATPase, partial [Paludibacter sp.]|nr:AAA family ATPase [Paludibacter sp.]
MEVFFRTHKYLVEHIESPVNRLLMNEIDWSHRLIGIKGSRGVGKTTFLLQYAKDFFGADNRQCLYISFNNFYFTQHTLVEFAAEFYAIGGRTLLLDQTFKYENWSRELRQCYDRFPELHIVFSGSTVMRLIEGNEELKDIVAAYNLRGFSFREFIYLKTAKSFQHYTLKQIIENHRVIANKICEEINPLDYFADYLHHGFYPFFLEKRNFSENLLKTMNMMLEVDILLIKQIDLKYLPKIRKLLYILMLETPCTPNISRLSNEIQVSRATIMNYIKYLQDARLLNLLYAEGDVFPKKPRLIYLQNSNLIFVAERNKIDNKIINKTFLYNALHARHKVNIGQHDCDFRIDRNYQIKAGKKSKNPKTICAVDNL